MDNKVFKTFSELIERECGIHLTDQKRSLLSNRIQKRLRVLGLKDESAYLDFVSADSTGDEIVRLIDVVSTNVTHFYRESKHFEILAQILQERESRGIKRTRIWCAASSSGEEPYTIAMTANESVNLKSSDLKILATDIATHVLKKAMRAVYEDRQLEKLPIQLKSKYFKKEIEDGCVNWRVDPEITKMVVFRKHNLSQFPYPLKGSIDIIFCRNVMIYFDMPLRAKIINEFSRLLSPGGHLFLSHSENLLGIKHDFESRAVAVFRKPEKR